MNTNHTSHHYGFLLAGLAGLSLLAGCASTGCCGADNCCEPSSTATNTAYGVTVGKDIALNTPPSERGAASADSSVR